LPDAAIAAVVLCAIGVTTLLGLGFGLLAVSLRTVTLSATEVASITPRWLAAFFLAAVIGLHLSRLVSRGGSHVATAMLLGLLATISDNRLDLDQGWTEPRQLAKALMSPLAQVMSGESLPLDAPTVAWTVLYALVLFLGATLLFRRKDLLWAE
jgi:hypothetical protein